MEKPNKSLERELPYLPPEMQQEILTWLPGKSLVRFQPTCKLWKSWVHDPTFAKKHYDRGGCRYKCIIYFLNFTRKAVFHREIIDRFMQPHHKLLIDLQSLQKPLPLNYNISYSCNGIFCIYSRDCKDNIILYNPLTKESMLLPGPSTLISCINAQIFGYEVVYIGFIPSKDEYKIMCFIYDNGSSTLEHCTIFSISSWSWNKITTGFALPLSATPIFAKGIMFWLKYYETSVLWFDLDTEQMGIIDPPPQAIMPDRISLSEVEGSLVLLYRRDKDYMSIWKLQDVARGVWMRCDPIHKPIFVSVEESDSCFWDDVIFHRGRASFVLEDKLYINVSILGDSQVVYCFNGDGKRLDMLVQPNLHVHSLLSLKKFVPSNCGNC